MMSLQAVFERTQQVNISYWEVRTVQWMWEYCICYFYDVLSGCMFVCARHCNGNKHYQQFSYGMNLMKANNQISVFEYRRQEFTVVTSSNKTLLIPNNCSHDFL
jgi:hypothetical protein